MLEQFGYQGSRKFVLVDYYEGVASLRPPDKFSVPLLFQEACPKSQRIIPNYP